jgi:acetyl-CoA C-acetyltransferase
MALDPRTPVIVGVGPQTRRLTTAVGATDPAHMMAEVLEAAADDAGVGRAVLEAATGLRTVDMLTWRYNDPPAAIASILGIDPAEHLRTTVGGNSPQMLVNATCEAIADGRQDVVLIAGAEVGYTKALARREGVFLEWSKAEDAAACAVMGDDRQGVHEAELAVSLFLPTQIYPLFENAVRHAAGRSVADHTARVAGLWSRFSEVASKNPNAWMPTHLSPEEIATAGPDNRMVAFPYTKLQVANIQVDQAAALIVCSVEAARRLGISEDRWVFPLAGAEAADHWFVSERWSLTESPAIAACGRALAAAAGTAPADATHVDLYSCFPVAVELAAEALGLDLERQLTLTGGLTFGGGPGNNYATHGIAQVVNACRSEPGTVGLATALGWYVTKHALGLYSTAPPAESFQRLVVQDEVDALPRREAAVGFEGRIAVETATVGYERDGSVANTFVASITPDGARTWVTTTDGDIAAAVESGGLLGDAVKIAAGALTI